MAKCRFLMGLFLVIVVFSGYAKAAEIKKDNPLDKAMEGAFRSVRGVLVILSCYCLNGGYLKIDEKREENLCFDGVTDEEITCKTIFVRGHHVTKTITQDKLSPCMAGEMEYFQVTSYECRD